jgi:hypothetical protein
LGGSAPNSGIQAAETTAREIDVAVRDLIAEAFNRAVEILKARRADLDLGGRTWSKAGRPAGRILAPFRVGNVNTICGDPRRRQPLRFYHKWWESLALK